PRPWTRRGRSQNRAGNRVDSRDLTALRACHPHHAVVITWIVGAGGDPDALTNCAGVRIDSRQRTVVVGHQPDTVTAGSDSSLSARGPGLEKAAEHVATNIDLREPCGFATKRHPKAAKPNSKAGAGLTRQLNSRHESIGPRVDAVYGI